jgi:DedD protein
MDFLLKQRLVGAIVLVALGVIFIPMLLEDPDRDLVPDMQPLPEPADMGIEQSFEAFPPVDVIPDEPDESVVQDAVQPLPDAEPGTLLTLPPETQSQVAPQPDVAPQPESGPGKMDSPPPVEPAETAPLGNWIIQMGSFSSEANAIRLRDQLRKGGFTTQVIKAKIDARTLFRVQVGPYLERQKADADQQKLAGEFALKGKVLTYP